MNDGEKVLKVIDLVNNTEKLEEIANTLEDEYGISLEYVTENIQYEGTQYTALLIACLIELILEKTPTKTNKQSEAVKSGEVKIALKTTEDDVYPLWIELADMKNKDKIEFIANKLGVTGMTVRRKLRGLTEKGLIKYGHSREDIN